MGSAFVCCLPAGERWVGYLLRRIHITSWKEHGKPAAEAARQP